MPEKIENVVETVTDRIENFEDDHPVAWTAGVCVIGAVLFVPTMIALYRWYAHVEGRVIAKELVKAGVQLGYNHP